MTWFIARYTAADNKVKSISDDTGMHEFYRLYDLGWDIYRIDAAPTPGQFLLIPQQLTGVTTTPITTGGTLEDVP